MGKAETKFTGKDLKKIREKHKMSRTEFGALFGRTNEDYRKVETSEKKLHGLWQLIIGLIHKHGIDLIKDVQPPDKK